ncbi:hypothetical protein J4E93_009030 [Alternaria ventricosa]|uniref:uncharacterized protein n=1 Tax=Alternaria ventricosa TaxID=1187951 RepID=UPI0020C28B61|nr:uncharacterized protein J4E93_009030 [Alternaria ventricosa]KAI4639676.1 hypothetical protein J4E93_009030 [Alternaria ventricosa]
MAQPATPARRTLYNDPTFSDIEIRQIYKGQVKEYDAHKAVLCAHSGWFMAALTGRFKEASSDTIEVHEDDPDTFQTMMEFFYEMELKKSPPGRNTDSVFKSDVIPLIALHILADKYDAKSLQKAAMVAFETRSEESGSKPSLETTKMLIHAYYSVCPGVMGDMGQAIVKYIFGSYSYSLKAGNYNTLAVQYGNFGADLFLVGRATSKLVCISQS